MGDAGGQLPEHREFVALDGRFVEIGDGVGASVGHRHDPIESSRANGPRSLSKAMTRKRLTQKSDAGNR